MAWGSSAWVVGASVAACGLVGLLFLFACGHRLHRRRYAAGALHGLSALVFFLGAIACALVGLNLLTYDRLTREQPVLTAGFARVAPQEYNATLTYPSGEVREYVLLGDAWQIDARVLKWRGIATVLGFDTAYRLERLGGRYNDPELERTAPRTVHVLHAAERLDLWTLLRGWHAYLPWVDALYGSAIYLPMADGATYAVAISPTGLLARPVNAAAQAAVGAWH